MTWCSVIGQATFTIVLSCSIVVKVTIKQCCGSILIIITMQYSFLALCTWNSADAFKELNTQKTISKISIKSSRNVPWLLRDGLYEACSIGEPMMLWRALQPLLPSLYNVRCYQWIYRCLMHYQAQTQESKNRSYVTSGLLISCGSYSLVSYRLSFCRRVYSLDGESPRYSTFRQS